MQEIEKGIKEGKISVPVPSVPNLLQDSRTEAIETMRTYICESMIPHDNPFDKYPMLGTSGMKGIGKTTMLQYGLTKLLPDMRIKAKGAYLTFSGGGGQCARVFQASLSQGATTVGSFGHVLLATLGVKREQYTLLDFGRCLELFRKAVGTSDDESLIIFVDEIGELEGQATVVLRDLMAAADGQKGKLVFIFAHIDQEVLNQLASGSGRRVIPLPLEALPVDTWKSKKNWKQAAEEHASIKQLALQLCGHPRSIYQGLDEALRANPTLLTDPTPEAVIQARQKIIEIAKFNSFKNSWLDDVVPKWFRSARDGKFVDELRRDGLLLKLPETEFLMPLVLSSWAQQQAGAESLPYHLQQAYAADAILGEYTEKMMEGVMMHYEALLRRALGQEAVSLGDFYQTEHICQTLRPLQVMAKQPCAKDLVARVKDFSQKELVLLFLQDGYIVVSDEHNEKGVEYLTPFHERYSEKLMVACAQCKFMPDGRWGAIKQGVERATEWLRDMNILCFPVVYTVADVVSMRQDSYEGGIYFNALDTFEFTKRLGVLRLHTQKLGQKLGEKYKWLKD